MVLVEEEKVQDLCCLDLFHSFHGTFHEVGVSTFVCAVV